MSHPGKPSLRVANQPLGAELRGQETSRESGSLVEDSESANSWYLIGRQKFDLYAIEIK